MIQTEKPQGGYSIQEWCAALTISRSTFYSLPVQPHLVHLGRRVVIREDPPAYLARIAAEQAKPQQIAA